MLGDPRTLLKVTMVRIKEDIESGGVFTETGPYGQLGAVRLPDGYRDPYAHLTSAYPWTMTETGGFIPAHRRESWWQARIKTTEIDSIVFDVDGLLVNSEPLILMTIFECAKSLLKEEHQRRFSEHASNIKRHCFGRSDEDMSFALFKYLSGKLPQFHQEQMLREEFHSFSEDQFNDYFRVEREPTYIRLCEAGLAQPMPGAAEFVEACYLQFGPLAINTGSPEVLSSPMLDAAFKGVIDLERIFPSHLRTYVSDLERGKPEPDGYVRASVLLNQPRERLIAVVDRGNDAISALRAGYAKVVVVPENMDFTPLGRDGVKEKYSVARFLDSLGATEGEKREMANKVVIIGSLAMANLM